MLQKQKQNIYKKMKKPIKKKSKGYKEKTKVKTMWVPKKAKESMHSNKISKLVSQLDNPKDSIIPPSSNPPSKYILDLISQ